MGTRACLFAVGLTLSTVASPASAQRKEKNMTLALSSPEFREGGAIPDRYACEGKDISPPLAWSGAPEGTRSFALIVEDPDAPDPAAPKRTWVHWVLYNLPASSTGLTEDVKHKGLPEGARQGRNDWHKAGYGGPCPPVGRHRYVHKLYALDTALPEVEGLTKSELESAMAGHVLARAELVGTYEKRKR
jgi:Raf kinase inhibitor-like YbhB/YbcL family protein